MRVMMGARALAARLVSHCAHIVAKRSSLVVVALFLQRLQRRLQY